MNFDWLKSISARVGVEGRNTVIVSGLGFCGFGIWLFVREFERHPLLSWVFLSAFFALGGAIALVGLLAKPQPSEVAQSYFVQQNVDKQFLYAGGFQSQSDMVEFLRAAHEIEYLPRPSGIVAGSAADESTYKDISAEEADELARKDREGVQRLLWLEADKIQSSLGLPRAAGGVPKQIAGTDAGALKSPKEKE